MRERDELRIAAFEVCTSQFQVAPGFARHRSVTVGAVRPEREGGERRTQAVLVRILPWTAAIRPDSGKPLDVTEVKALAESRHHR